MPRLLYRYILAELLRVGVLTTLILVTVIAFGAAVKPIAHENLLTAGQTLKYVVLAIVPMLQFALPFASGFAATMVMHRFAADNEILAMKAGGLSHRRILMPVFGIGVGLTLAMIVLTQLIIPQFWGLMRETVTHDLTRVFQTSIEKGESFEIGSRHEIWAERIIVEENPEGSDADTRLRLWEIAVAEKDPDTGRVVRDTTAAQAAIDVYRNEHDTRLMMALHEAVRFDERTGELVHAIDLASTSPIVIPNVLEHDLRAMTRAQMLDLYENPDWYHSVVRRRSNLIEVLAEHDLWDQISLQIAEEGSVTLFDRNTPTRRFRVDADGMSAGQFTTSDGRPVSIVRFDNDNAAQRIQAEVVHIIRGEDRFFGDRLLELRIGRADVRNLETGIVNERSELQIGNLEIRGEKLRDFESLSSDALVAAAGNRIPLAVEALTSRIDRLRREISSRLWKRYALSVTAVLLVALGATLAIMLRNSQPLSIYLWAFLPSVLDLILISGGEQAMRDGAMTKGLFVMWSGNVVLLVLFVSAFLRISRN